MALPQDVCSLLVEIRDHLAVIREAERLSDYLVIRDHVTTTGGQGLYAAADTFRFPLFARSFMLQFFDIRGGFFQVANERFQEWTMIESQLVGPVALSHAMSIGGIRIRAIDANAGQAVYSLSVAS